MATRIVRLTTTLAASAANQEMTGSPLSPPAGLKWTIVELRPTFGDTGHVTCLFDTETYHTIDSEDVNQYGKPQTVALDVVQPHKYVIQATDDSGNGQDVIFDIVLEESPQAGA